MKINSLFFTYAIFLFLLFHTTLSHAAPIIPLGPVTVSGTIQTAIWMPEKTIKGIPGMSGSLGHDRVIPAHFMITLNPYQGVDAKTAATMIRYVDWPAAESLRADQPPPFVKIRINSDNKNEFQPGSTIEVTEYTVNGDEGGTWTHYSSINIINKVAETEDKK